MRILCWLMAFLWLSTGALAQSINALDLFSDVLSLVETKAAQKSWEKLDRTTYDCMRGSLQQQGVTITQLAASGISPSDPRLRDLIGACEAEGDESDYADDTSGVLDDIEMALTNRKSIEIDHQAEADLLALQAEATQLVYSAAPELKEAARALVRQIDQALLAPESSAVDRIRVRLAQLAEASEVQSTWNRLLTEGRSLSASVSFADLADLPAGIGTRRASLVEAFELVTRPMARKPKKYDLPAGNCDGESNPIGALICDDADARWILLENARAYYLLRFLRPSQRDEISAASVAFQRALIEKCAVRSALAKPQKHAKAVVCVSSRYAAETDRLSADIRKIATATVLDELVRPIDRHLQLQGELLDLGYLPTGAEVDGIYGPQTRAGIEQLEVESDWPASGIMTDRVAAKLDAAIAGSVPPDRESVAQLGTAVEDLRKLKVEIAEAKRVVEVAAQQKVLHERNIATARKLLGGYLDDDLRTFLLEYVDGLSKSPPDADEVARLDARYASLAGALTRAEQLNALMTSEGRVLVNNEGGFVILYNSGPKAPSVSKGLSGNLVFSGDAAACGALATPPDRFTAGQLRQSFARIGARVRMPLPACNLEALQNYDLVLFRNDTVKSDALAALLGKMRDGLLETAAVVSSADISSAKSARDARVAVVTQHIRSNDQGFGYLRIDNDSKGICAITPEGLDAHRMIISTDLELVADELEGSPDYLVQSADDAFISAKRHQCGAVYADSADLGTLATAFARDGIEYSYWPFWYDEAVLAAAAADAEAAKKRQVEADADNARESMDEEAIAEAKAADAEAVRQKQQLGLRQKYGAAAKAFELSLADELTEFVTDAAGSRRFAVKYPVIAADYQRYLADGWELVDHATEIEDYGMAEFKSRRLELGIARSTIKLRNRILGEYKSLCYVTAFVNDAEFSMEREPFGVECTDGAKSLDTYRLGERFESLWVAQ